MTRGDVLIRRWILSAPEGPLVAGGLLALLAMIEAILRAEGSGVNVSTALLLGVCATVPVAFAQAHTLASAVLVTAATCLTLVIYQRPTLAGLVTVPAVSYLLGRRCSGRITLLVLSPLAVNAIAGARVWGVVVLFLAAGAAGLGYTRRQRREAALRDESRRSVEDSLLEHAARGERARIARELHDVVAHHISMISVQAETARLATPGMPPDGARRLLAIGDTARTALTEMRRLLGVLREDAGTAPTRKPQPGLTQLNELIDEARDSTGASTRLIVRGQVRALDPGVELTAYRIVQEALTNARRHAPGTAVDIELDYGTAALHLLIRDNGPGPPPAYDAAEGHGLLGMRERAATVGGTLRTGRGPLGGFLIEARLPCEPER